jgi:hypothetical protein
VQKGNCSRYRSKFSSVSRDLALVRMRSPGTPPARKYAAPTSISDLAPGGVLAPSDSSIEYDGQRQYRKSVGFDDYGIRIFDITPVCHAFRC